VQKKIMRHRDSGLDEIYAIHGLAAKIARELGISRAAVCAWRKVPIRHLREVARISGIPKERLRPDIFEDTHEVAA
jgi:DNA-binding transcriptional regulator YdaS (Cro superfamily)